MATKTKSASAAKKVRTRRRISDAGVYTPPLPPIKLLTAGTDDIAIHSPGASIGIARALASAPYELKMDGASTLTLNVIDGDDRLLELLDVDENAILDQGVTAVVGGIYWRLMATSQDGSSPLALTFIDDVAWAMDRNDKPLKTSRGQSTRAGFVYRMADEARRKPSRYFRIYIPELNDLQHIAKPTSDDGGVSKPTDAADGTAGGSPGFSDGDDVKVKGVKATAKQRRVIDEALAEAHRLGCSDRVLVAVVMTVVDESNAGLATGQTGNDDVGEFQQGRNWISAANVGDVAKETRAFLLGHEANVGGNDSTVKGWKQTHGSLRNAPANLSLAIHEVQRNADPNAYAAFEAEAKRTVKAWNPASTGGSTDGSSTSAKAYEFTRGTSEGREGSFTASGRLVDELNQGGGEASWHRWAVLNTFWYASDEDLRQAKPSLTLHKSAPWLLGRPSHTWNANRPVTEMSFTVLARDWGLLPGAVVAVPSSYRHLAGRWIVRSVNGTIGGHQVQVTVHRPVAKAPEPAHDTATTSSGDGDGAGGDGSDVARLLAACEHISKQGRNYLLGGGHGPALTSIKAGDPLDCSSSVSLALFRAGLWPKGQKTALVSGDLAKWGKAGKGDGYTVQANDSHVWIEFESGRYKRFDTSPHGSGERGPRVRTTARNDQSRFTARHW